MAVGTEPRSVDGELHPPAKEPIAIKPAGTENGQVPKTARAPISRRGWLQWLWNHKGAILALVILLLVIVGIGWMLLRPNDVMVAIVVEQEIVAEVQGTGTVTTKVLANIGSKISGRIEKMLVQEGDVVEMGQIIAVLEDTDLRRHVDLARAELEVAQASAKEARRTWERVVKLLLSRAASQEEADIAEARNGVTEKTVKSREAHLAYEVYKLSEGCSLSGALIYAAIRS